MNVVRLKNGAEEPQPIVVAVMMTLKDLWVRNPIFGYELVMKCRNPSHVFFGKAGDELKKLALVEQNGLVHDSIRNIVMSAIEGEDLDMVLCSPLQN